MLWTFIIFCFLISAESFQRMCWICAETLQEIRWNFIVFTFSQVRWNFSTDVLNLRWNIVRIALKFYDFTSSQKRWNFSTDLLNLCWNFARDALKFFLFSRFLKNAETFQRICWICAETLWEIRRKKRWIFFKNCTQNALKLCFFYVFSRALEFSYGWTEFVLKLCKTCAEFIFFYVFSRALKFF